MNSYQMYGYGKFDDSQDEMAYNAGLDGCDSETGDVSEYGVWYGLLRDFDGFAGVIISEDSQGFVSCAYYENSDDLSQDWQEIEEEVLLWYEPDPDWMN